MLDQKLLLKLTEWADVPFGVKGELTHDLGWKREIDHPVQLPSQPHRAETETKYVDAYLPRQIFPSCIPADQGEMNSMLNNGIDQLDMDMLMSSMEQPDENLLENGTEGVEEQLDIASAQDHEESASRDGKESVVCFLGPVASEISPSGGQTRVELSRFESIRLDDYLPGKPGFMFNAGGLIAGLDWHPDKDLLAVATQSILHPLGPTIPATEQSLLQFWSLGASPTDLAPTTQPLSKGEGPRLELGLLFEGIGEAWQIKWRPPCSSQPDTLGCVSGTFTDGGIYLFVVPHLESYQEKPVYDRISPTLGLRVEDAHCQCLAWASHDTLAAGCSNGWIAIWNLSQCWNTQNDSPVPQRYFPLHTATINSISWLQYPDINVTGEAEEKKEPAVLTTSAADGCHKVVDIRDPVPTAVLVERTVYFSGVWSPHLGSYVVDDNEHAIKHYSNRPGYWNLGKTVGGHGGTVWEMATSNHHPFAATVSADGCCLLVNLLRDLLRPHHTIRYSRKLYRIDFNRKTWEYRVIDNIKPEERLTARAEVNASRKRGTGKITQDMHGAFDSGAWPPQISINRVCWHPSPNRHSLLASGGAMGIVRIDWVELAAEQ